MNADHQLSANGPEPMLDVIGVGFGPANIAVAIALEELGVPLNVLFLERQASTTWHEGMLLEDADIQNHPLRDLVTPRNPRSRYSFTNFLFENGRFFEHLNLGLPFPLRIEYAEYVRWAASFFAEQVRYGVNVEGIEILTDPATGVVGGYQIRDDAGRTWRARSIIVAPGRTPNVPALFAGVDPVRIVHLNDYLPTLARACEGEARPRVAVVGGSQSAVEILLHVDGISACESVVGITRNFGFRLKDTSPFSDEVYFPQFVETFFSASQTVRDKLRAELVTTNYSSADKDVLERLYTKLYVERLLGRDRLSVRTNTDVTAVEAGDHGIQMVLRDTVTGSTTTDCFDLVILATGFLDIGVGPQREAWPALLSGVASRLALENGHLNVSFDYKVQLVAQDARDMPIYLNGLCESSHGMGDSGSFSLLALRSAAIVQSLASHLGVTPTVPARHNIQS